MHEAGVLIRSYRYNTCCRGIHAFYYIPTVLIRKRLTTVGVKVNRPPPPPPRKKLIINARRVTERCMQKIPSKSNQKYPQLQTDVVCKQESRNHTHSRYISYRLIHEWSAHLPAVMNHCTPVIRQGSATHSPLL
jgi:hypothetical protein